MAIPKRVTIKHGPLPAKPGVYLFRDARGRLLYIGKATSLKTRVNSHFVRPHDARIAKMTEQADSIEYIETPTAVEALMLESRLIKKHQPHYNVLSKDDKSYIHLAFTKEDFPRPVFIRQHELARLPKSQFLKVLGPFRSAGSVQAALDATRKAFPWTECRPPKPGKSGRPCFYRHLGQCPGVCTAEIKPAEYRKIIRQLIRFLEGGRDKVTAELEAAMSKAAAEDRFEDAALIRDRLAALNQVRDLSVLKREEPTGLKPIDIYGRIEGYDISNISGTDTVGSLVTFVDGRPRKSQYRKFIVQSVDGPDDTKAMAEVLMRRLEHAPSRAKSASQAWPLPDLILVDGGVGQVNAANQVLKKAGMPIPVVGIAKGPDRKGEELVFAKNDYELARLTAAFKPLLLKVRDEAHRFAITFHRQRRSRRLTGGAAPVKNPKRRR
jgi:excinuclease ABC subunit C